MSSSLTHASFNTSSPSISFNCAGGGDGDNVKRAKTSPSGGSGGCSPSRSSNRNRSPDGHTIGGVSVVGGSGKCTVREVKKRSRNSKSRTLPGRLKLLQKRKSITPPPNPNLSIFKLDSGQHWCLDMDAYGIYMDHHHESPHRLRDPYATTGSSSTNSCGGNNNSSSGSSGRQFRSKSLTRADAEKAAAQRKRSTTSSNSNHSNSNDTNRSRSRSRSRLSNSVFSVSQCFGLGSSPPVLSLSSNNGHCEGDDDDDDLSDCYCAASSGTAPGDTSTSSMGRSSRKKVRSRNPYSSSRSSSNLLRVDHHHLDRDCHNDSSSFEFLDDDDEEEDEENRYYPSDTSYDKACGSERRSSAPLTPLLGGRETPSRFANFFSKRSFKSNPLKRTKSVTKLERKKPPGGTEQESNVLYPSRLRTSRSHESLLAWTNNPNNFVNNGMMSTVDLTAGDVVIRTLHPSILGQDFAFQVITPSGSKYYSCSSGPERDAWVHALRQAIKPHSDEIRRQESSLKLWILEAKGMPGGSGKHSKRFFCELYLDDVLYARTCAKPRGEMLFWGEHFEFSQLPNCVQLITVVFFREGDKKRKKERNTCIGKVKIPVNTVNSRYLIEKWYPVIPESGSSQTLNKDKDGPSLRIKCKFQSVDILPLRCYRAFLQYVKDEYGPVSECLETVLSVKAKEDLASAMVHVLHHEGLAKEFIAELALQEILKSGDEKLTFRGNSIATKAMEAFLKLTGTEYLHATLGSFIEQFQNAEDVDCEIDPMKLPQASSSTLNKNQQNLRMAIDNVWKYILHSDSMFPMELRECFAHCREALKSAGKEDLSDHLISASIFLRFLCPAILSPSLFNITNEYPTEKSARNLTLVAKILQTLANFTRFQGKENYMEFVNDFVEREAPNMKEFLARISSPLSAEAVKKLQKENRDKVPAGGFIDLGKYLSVLSTLLSESIAKIAPKNDRFKQLQEILENIHLWLKQPANATNVSMFPFPHLTSPPPTVPPPPAPIGIHNIHINHHPRVTAQNPQAVNHQYQVPHHNNNNCPNNSNSAPQPIYAVSNVIHNTSNPNVKNISQVHIPPLQLQIPPVPTVLGLNSNINNPRSGSQASSGYQSQSPVLEGCEEKSKKTPNEHVNDFKNQYRERKESSEKGSNQNSFNNANFENSNNNNNRKFGSQSVDDLSSLGVEPGDELGFKKRLTRSSSSSDCEYAPTSVISNNKSKTRSSQQKFNHHALLQPGQGNNKSHSKPKMVPTPHHRLSRRSSAELLRKNHPYSSSTDEDSDSGHNNVSERDDSLVVPQLPPRRLHGNSKRSFASARPNPDGSLSSNGEKSLEEYEREMLDLRRAMEALQLKLNRAEERLFGHDSSNNQSRRESDIFLPSAPSPNGGNSLNGSGPRDRLSLKSADENSLEMDHLLQRLLCAEEEMKREQELLTALDRKQKLIDAQEQKIARLDAVNNQLLEALAQIRDSLQQQHVLAQQQKIQMQLQKQQQHLQSLASGSIHVLPASPTNRNFTSHHHLQSTNFNLHNNNNNNNSHSHTNGSMNNNNGVFLDHSVPLHMSGAQPQATSRTANNTTKVLITSDSSGESGSVSPTMSLEIPNHAHDLSDVSNPRDSATFLGEQALKMLAELKSSSC